MTRRLLRFAMTLCLGLAAALGASVASASVIVVNPSQGYSDSPFSFGGVLEYTGSTLTSWQLTATNGTSFTFQWLTSNSLVSPLDGSGTNLTFSSEGHTATLSSGSGNISDLTGTSSTLDWNFFHSWCCTYANGSAYALVLSDGPGQVPAPASWALLAAGIAIFRLARRKAA
jgi:hypothetical protein